MKSLQWVPQGLGIVSIAALAWACGTDPVEGGPDASGPRDASAITDAGAADGGRADATPGLDASPGPIGETPLVDRPLRAVYDCELTRDRTDHSPRQWGGYGHALITTTDGRAVLSRIESSPPGPFDPAPASFIASTFGADGTFGAPVQPTPTSTVADISSHALARRGDGFAMLWVERGGLRFAAFDANRTRVVPPVAIDVGPELPMFGARPRLAEGSDGGFGVVFVRPDGSDRSETWWVGLDARGARLGEPRRLAVASGPFVDPAPAIEATSGGFAIVYRDVANERGHVFFTQVDARGVEVIAPRRLSVTDQAGTLAGAGAGFDRPRLALRAVPDGYLAAWTELVEGNVQLGSGASSIVRLARLDASGVVAGVPIALRAREVDVDEVGPTLTRLADDAVAVMWARGSHIYACGGCMPDHRLDLVVVDPRDLSKIGALVTIPEPTVGGMMAHDVAWQGELLTVTYEQTFHVHAAPGSASITCVR